LLFADPKITDLLQGEHPEIFAGIGMGWEKVAFDVQKLQDRTVEVWDVNELHWNTFVWNDRKKGFSSDW